MNFTSVTPGTFAASNAVPGMLTSVGMPMMTNISGQLTGTIPGQTMAAFAQPLASGIPAAAGNYISQQFPMMASAAPAMPAGQSFPSMLLTSFPQTFSAVNMVAPAQAQPTMSATFVPGMAMSAGPAQGISIQGMTQMGQMMPPMGPMGPIGQTGQMMPPMGPPPMGPPPMPPSYTLPSTPNIFNGAPAYGPANILNKVPPPSNSYLIAPQSVAAAPTFVTGLAQPANFAQSSFQVQPVSFPQQAQFVQSFPSTATVNTTTQQALAPTLAYSQVVPQAQNYGVSSQTFVPSSTHNISAPSQSISHSYVPNNASSYAAPGMTITSTTNRGSSSALDHTSSSFAVNRYSFNQQNLHPYAIASFAKFDRNKSGALGLDELINAFSEFASLNGMPPISGFEIQALAKRFDYDNNNVISFGEYKAMLETFGGYRSMPDYRQTSTFVSKSYT